MNKNKYWRIIKRNLSFFIAIVGIIIPIICYHLSPGLNILLEPLSKFGIAKETKTIWTVFLQVIALLLYISNDNLIDNIKDNITKLQYRLITAISLVSSISLSLTGLIDMKSTILHLGFAAIFFLAYTSFIFWWGFLNIKYDLKTAIISISTSVIIMLISIISIMGMDFGYGVFEVVFITLIIIWNIKVKK